MSEKNVRLVVILCESIGDFQDEHFDAAEGLELVQLPEMGLGPKLQLEKGDELIHKSLGGKTVVWTTSEYIVLRIRRRILETNTPAIEVEEGILISDAEVEFYYLSPETKDLIQLHINERGQWVREEEYASTNGYFTQDTQEVLYMTGIQLRHWD